MEVLQDGKISGVGVMMFRAHDAFYNNIIDLNTSSLFKLLRILRYALHLQPHTNTTHNCLFFFKTPF